MNPPSSTVTIGALISLSLAAHAQVNTTGGITLVQEGGGFDTGNLSVGAIPIGKDELNYFNGTSYIHRIVDINDVLYGNSESWLGNSMNSWVGVGFGGLQTINSFAFGRDNLGTYTDRALGLFTLEYTTDPNAAANPNGAVWTSVGTLDYIGATAPGTLFSTPSLRHRFNLASPITATAVRLVAPGDGLASGAVVDELEVYGGISGTMKGITVSPSPGFALGWNGNDGAHFGATTPATVPANLALASNGATAFASSELGVQLGVPFHRAVNLNDGLYGNANSWIGADGDSVGAVGVLFSSLQSIGAIAFGRDNGNNDTDCCGGQLTDRWQGVYTLQITLDGSLWTTIGTVNLSENQDTDLDGAFTGYYRHEFSVGEADGDPLSALGVRILVPGTGLAPTGTAIDEIEVYAVAPEPASVALLLAGFGAVLGFRRNRTSTLA